MHLNGFTVARMIMPLLPGCGAKMSKHMDKAAMLLMLLLLPTSECYSMGAPDAACNAMTPGHQQQAQKVETKIFTYMFYIKYLEQ